jgi:hypothetical protein
MSRRPRRGATVDLPKQQLTKVRAAGICLERVGPLPSIGPSAGLLSINHAVAAGRGDILCFGICRVDRPDDAHEIIILRRTQAASIIDAAAGVDPNQIEEFEIVGGKAVTLKK